MQLETCISCSMNGDYVISLLLCLAQDLLHCIFTCLYIIGVAVLLTMVRQNYVQKGKLKIYIYKDFVYIYVHQPLNRTTVTIHVYTRY